MLRLSAETRTRTRVPDYVLLDENRKPVGPVSLKDVVAMHRTGSLRSDSLLLTGGGATRRVDEVLAHEGLIPVPRRPTPHPRCPACGEPVGNDVQWCPSCHASTRDFVDASLAAPGQRLFAWLLDSVLPSVLGLTIGVRVVSHGRSPIMSVLSLAYAIYACMLYSRGTTPGKNLLDLEVLDADGDPAGFWRMIVREWIAKPLSGLVFGLGFLWILIDDERQGWHDKLCDTHVVVRPDGND